MARLAKAGGDGTECRAWCAPQCATQPRTAGCSMPPADQKYMANNTDKGKFTGGRPTMQKWDITDGVVGLQHGIPLASKTTVPPMHTSCIFLPAAGNRNESNLNNAGSNGNYWSSSLNSSSNAWNHNFNSSSCSMNSNNRYNGQSVRPVCVSAQHLL